MVNPPYDAIVVGARCAGSPTAMLLARKGWRVLTIDRATFPSDTLSTHVVHPRGAAALARWGLLDRLKATGCPPIDTYAFDFGPFTISGTPGTPEAPVSYCPRRTVLDKLLVDAAAEAGAQIREGFTVDEVLTEDGRVVGIKGHAKGGERIAERARTMFTAGVVTEARTALAGEISSTAVHALGLRDVAELPQDAALEAVIIRTRRYAAYQRKWMRRIPGLVSVNGDRPTGEVADDIVQVASTRERLPAPRAG